MKKRVQKILSQLGIASRRHAEILILEKRLKLNGQIVLLGDKADPNHDLLELDGKIIKSHKKTQLFYILVNKPVGIICSCKDSQNRSIVMDLLPSNLRKGMGIHPVGRLDMNSSGALLLTNDGNLTLRLTHPRYHLPKIYEVLVRGNFTQAILKDWRQGVVLDGEKTLPAYLEVINNNRQYTNLKIILTEGKNRHIRRIAQKFELDVIKLHRTAIGPISLSTSKVDNVKLGHYRLLSSSEINTLKYLTKLFNNDM